MSDVTVSGTAPPQWLWRNLSAQEPSERKRHFPITCIRIVTRGEHDVLTLWNRGGNSGTWTVVAGDGMKIAELLTAGDDVWHLAQEREG